MTAALEEGEWSAACPGRTLPPGKDTVPILQEAGWDPGPVSTGGKSRPHRDSIPDRPARTSVAIPTELPGPHTHTHTHTHTYIYIYIYILKFHFILFPLILLFDHPIVHSSPFPPFVFFTLIYYIKTSSKPCHYLTRTGHKTQLILSSLVFQRVSLPLSAQLHKQQWELSAMFHVAVCNTFHSPRTIHFVNIISSILQNFYIFRY